MHEISLCEGILDVVETETKNKNFTTVKRVVLDIGRTFRASRY